MLHLIWYLVVGVVLLITVVYEEQEKERLYLQEPEIDKWDYFLIPLFWPLVVCLEIAGIIRKI